MKVWLLWGFTYCHPYLKNCWIAASNHTFPQLQLFQEFSNIFVESFSLCHISKILLWFLVILSAKPKQKHWAMCLVLSWSKLFGYMIVLERSRLSWKTNVYNYVKSLGRFSISFNDLEHFSSNYSCNNALMSQKVNKVKKGLKNFYKRLGTSLIQFINFENFIIKIKEINNALIGQKIKKTKKIIDLLKF